MSLVSLRFTFVVDEEARTWLPAAREQPTDDVSTYGAFWTFVDVRDAATACRLALEFEQPGHEAFYICAPIIYRKDDIRDLMAKHFPGDYPIGDSVRGAASPVDVSKGGAAARLEGALQLGRDVPGLICASFAFAPFRCGTLSPLCQ